MMIIARYEYPYPLYLHVFVEAVVEDEAVCDGEAVRLHWVAGAVVEVAHLGVVEVDHAVPAVRPGHRHPRWTNNTL